MENNCDLELRLFPTSSYDESDTSVVESRSCGNSLSKEEESQRITIFYSERMCVFSNVTHLQAKSIILIASREIEERSSSNGSDPQTEKISPKFSSETEDSNSSSFTVPLPSGDILTPNSLQSLGLSGLGSSTGFERLHYMLERVWEPILVPGSPKRISHFFLNVVRELLVSVYYLF
ncbi:unnamed protein product [Brassica oleracea]